jgi:biopolymer transport protein ExbB/TolQ
MINLPYLWNLVVEVNSMLYFAKNKDYTDSVKILFILITSALVMWPIITWSTYNIAGWKKWEKLYRREVTKDTDLVSSVSLKKF